MEELPYLYVVEDSSGNTEVYRSGAEALEKTLNNPRWKLHVYRRYTTLRDSPPPSNPQQRRL